MDTYIERLVVKKKSPSEIVMQVLIVFLALSLIFLVFSLSSLFSSSYIAFLSPIVAAAIGYAAYNAMTSLNIEYEIAITNEYFDIDKIAGKRKRKRVVSASIRSFESFGRYARGMHNRNTYQTRLNACNAGDENLWYAKFHDRKAGKTLIVFAADEEMLLAIQPYLTRKVKENAAFGN